jgi:hypothetical protein
MTYDNETPTTSADGAKSLQPESKVGFAVQFVITAALTGVAAALAGVDTSAWHGPWAQLGVAAVGTASGLVTAYLKRNR